MGITAWWKFGKWRRKGEIRKKLNQESGWWGKQLPLKNKTKKNHPPTQQLKFQSWCKKGEKKEEEKKKQTQKKKDFFYSLQNTSVPKKFPETATMPQGIANAFCHHSHPLKCTLDTTERKLGQRKNETKQNQSIAHQRKDSFFSGVQRNDVSLKQTNFLSLHAPHTRTLAQTHSHGLLVSL